MSDGFGTELKMRSFSITDERMADTKDILERALRAKNRFCSVCGTKTELVTKTTQVDDV